MGIASTQADWHRCDRCFTRYRYGPETVVIMFGDRPDYDYIVTKCLNCQRIDTVLGVGKELYESLRPEVIIVNYPVLTNDHRNRFLRNLDIGKNGCDTFERDLRLEYLAQAAKSLFPHPEDD